MSLGKQSAPPPPDYASAAKETAAGNLDAARAASAANRVSQYTPYGSLTYNQAGKDSYGNDLWSATTSLSPQQQQILDQQTKISMGLGSTMDQGLGYVKGMLDNPFDTSKLPSQMVNPGQTAQDAIMARLEPSFNRQQTALETQLANQGIGRNTEAWNGALGALGNQRNDAYIQAGLQGINSGQQARQQALQEQAFLRNEPLNTLNAVRSGAQVQGPTFQNTPQQATTAGPDMLGATQAQYQAQSGNANAANAGMGNMMGGLMGMAGTLGSSWLSNRKGGT